MVSIFKFCLDTRVIPKHFFSIITILIVSTLIYEPIKGDPDDR